ncbi:MAG: TlpA family protein disulfide reductase [Candidatus Omnitrophica bacterium]|nr:TlpA family protein disulfide reductase [Candidatus Omnitrophota bacterium]
MRSWVMGLLLAGAIINTAGCAVAQEESALLGKRAPDFTLERAKGTSASLYELIKGKKAILFFFASWCPHCREQLKEISTRKAEIKQEGIEIVLININEPKAKVLSLLEKYNVEYDSFMDSNSFVAQTYQVAGIPTLVFIGSDGLVRYVEYGMPNNYKQILN